jgi:1-acyl-sn-glycerol-3-phosphate acyltransferase
LNIILRILYYLLKGLTIVALRGFYGRITILHRERFKMDKGPYILVSNHPNTLLDPLLSGIWANRILFFLANASLFKTPFQNWFFSTFYCIRIERPTDVEGRPLQNDHSFALCDLHLNRNGVLYIAPEAYSFKGRKLMPIKTGTARIALSAEDKGDFQLGLKILPVGLNYESPYDFRSDVLIRVGEPLTVEQFEEIYREDPHGAVRQVTELLEARLRELVITTRDEEEDELLARLEAMLQHEEPVGKAEQHFRARRLLGGLQQKKEEEETEWKEWKTRVHEYFNKLDANGLSDQDIARPGNCHLPRRSVLALLSLPLFAYGWINNFLPAYIPAWMVRKLKQAEEYDATVKILTGLVTFPFCYILQYQIVDLLLPGPYPLLYLLSLAPMGLWAWELKKRYDRLRHSWRFERLRRAQPDKIRELFRQRRDLMEWVRGVV